MVDCKRMRLEELSPTRTSNSVPLMPDEVMLEIFSFSTLIDMIHCERACKRFHRAINANLPQLKKPFQFDLNYHAGHFDDENDDYDFNPDFKEFFWISFNGHDNPGNNTIAIRHSNSTLRANDDEDFLCTLEELEEGSSELWTTKPKEDILSAVYKRLARYCVITSIKIRRQNPCMQDDMRQTSYCGPFRLLEDVKHVDVMTLPDSRLLIEDLPRMPKLQILQICASDPEEEVIDFNEEPRLAFERSPMGIRNFDLRPLQRLQKLKIVSQYENSFSSIDDRVLLEARELKVLVLPNMRTEVTARGFGDVLEEWLEGRRDIDTIYLRLDGQDPFSLENRNRFLHFPPDHDKYFYYPIRRKSDGAELHVTVKDYHVLLRNRDSVEPRFTPFDFQEVPFIPYDEFPGYNYADRPDIDYGYDDDSD